jgi:hypothetical protein
MLEDRIVSQLRSRGYNLAQHFIEFHSGCAVIVGGMVVKPSKPFRNRLNSARARACPAVSVFVKQLKAPKLNVAMPVKKAGALSRCPVPRY